jgi:hypothetical protein
MKQKTCKICHEKFEATRQLQPTCNKYECLLEYANKHLSSKAKEKTKEARQKLREYNKTDKPILLQLAQKLVNKWIRTRDAGMGCISCGYNFSGFINNKVCLRVENAGHYVKVSKSSFLRFHEDNINLQCSYCNDQLDGNEGAYKTPLIEKIGATRVQYLEDNRNTLKTWAVEELQEIIKTYRAKIKETL